MNNSCISQQGLSTLYLEEIVSGSSSRITHIDVNMEELQRRVMKLELFFIIVII